MAFSPSEWQRSRNRGRGRERLLKLAPQRWLLQELLPGAALGDPLVIKDPLAHGDRLERGWAEGGGG